MFTIEDLVRLGKKKKKVIYRYAVLGALLFGAFALLRPAGYQLEASFKEAPEKGTPEGMMKDLLGGISGRPVAPEAVALMQSYQVLKPLVETQGTQAFVQRYSLPVKALRRIWENIRAEFGCRLLDPDWFVFENVVYEGEVKASWGLRFSDRSHFSVLDRNGKVEALGEVGRPVYLKDASFTLIKAPEKISLKKEYLLVIQPWLEVADDLKKKIRVVTNKINKSIHNLSYVHRDRKLGAKLLNGLMDEYRAYLKKNYNQTVSEQIAYLEAKQEEIYARLETVFDQHADYLKEMIEKKGFFALNQEIEGYLKPHNELLSKIFKIDVELSWLNRADKPEYINKDSPFGLLISKQMGEVRALEQERDMIEVSLLGAQGLERLDDRAEEMASLRLERKEAEELLYLVQQGKEWNLPVQFSWASSFQSPEQKHDFSSYLSNQIRLLSVREQLLSERLTHRTVYQPDFEGLSLPTSRHLFETYSKKLDQSEAVVQRLSHVKEEVDRGTFELGSLGSILSDTVSQELIQDASLIHGRLKDERYRSVKDEERWSEEAALQRKILSDHLEQLKKIEELNCSLFREKMKGVQQATLDCLNQKISVARAQIKGALQQQKETLQQEKLLLQKKIEEMRTSAVDLPERWKLEHWLDLKTALGSKIMTVLTELIESKTISQHLHHVESKPLDFANLPPYPQKPKFFFLSFVGAFLFSFLAYFFLFLKQFRKGFSLTLSKLKLLDLPCCGALSTFCDGPQVETVSRSDLETLRQLALFADKAPKGKTLLLLGGKKANYSYALAQNLVRAGKRPIVLRADFNPKFSPSDRPGLLQWLQEEIDEIPIRRETGFEVIPSGGFTPYSAEILQSMQFQELLAQLKQSYDLVLLWLPSSIGVAQSEILLQMVDKAVVTVEEESIEELTPLLNWAYHEGNNRLTFVCAE